MDRYKNRADVAEFLERRLHGVKLAANLMLKELSTSSRESIILTRSAALSIFHTIDTFIEDAETALDASGRRRSSTQGGAYKEVQDSDKSSNKYKMPERPLREVKKLK
jgi:hypothetical protein